MDRVDRGGEVGRDEFRSQAGRRFVGGRRDSVCLACGGFDAVQLEELVP